MTEYRAAEKLAGVRYDVRGPNLVEANKMEAAGEKIIKLNIGNTGPFGYAAPQPLVDMMVENMQSATGYSDSRGIVPARQAVVDYYATKNIPVDVEHVLIGNGASELISIILNALLDDGDEILLPAPDYPLWTGASMLSGGKVVHYLCDENNDWNPDLEDIRSKITPKTKAITLINPNNPTGAVYSREILQQIVDLAREHHLIIFSDEIYEKVLMPGAIHTPTAEIAGDDVLVFTFGGLSKAYRVCGYRSGWAFPTGPLHEMGKLWDGIMLLASMRLCANVPGQFAVKAALEQDNSIADLMVPGGRIYEQLTAAAQLLNEMPGVSCVPAQGSLYVFPRLDPEVYPIKDDEKWALELLKAKKILVTHGRGFNWPAPDHFRLVALPETNQIIEALGRVGEFLEDMREGRIPMM